MAWYHQKELDKSTTTIVVYLFKQVYIVEIFLKG